MNTNQLYLQKTGDGGFIEETGTFIAALSGNVGIGTSTPTTTLDVRSAGSGIEASLLLSESGSPNGGIRFSALDTSTYQVSIDQSDLGLVFDNTSHSSVNRPYVFLNGRVAIGSGTPGAKLEVNSASGEFSRDGVAYNSIRLRTDSANETRLGSVFEIVQTSTADSNLTYASNLDFQNRDSSGDYHSRLYIQHDGNVGIGTATPSGKLEIWQNSPTAPVLRLEDVGAASYDWTFPDAYKVKFSTNTVSTKDFILNNEGSGGMNLIVQSGNVGIGTATPISPLTISQVHSDSAGGIDNLITLAASEASGQDLNSGDGVGILFKVPVQSETQSIGARIAAVREGGTETATSTELVFEVSENDETLDEAMRIDRDGNVGIGTSAPGAPLSIKSSAALGIQFDRDAVNIGQISMHEDNLNVDANTNNLVFQTPASKYHIFSGGNVGIGTETPGYKLVVQADPAVSNDGMRITDENGSGRAMLYTAGAGHGALQLINDSNLPKVVIGSNENSYFNGGNVGIGTDAPSGKLEIWQNSPTAPVLRLEDVGAASYDWTFPDANKVKFSTNTVSAKDFILNNEGSGGMNLIVQSGNVGIGTSSPGAKLDVYTATNTNGLLIRTAETSGITHNLYVDTSNNGRVAYYASGQSQTVSINTSGDSYFNGGNVGIGTASPINKLSINGNASAHAYEFYQNTTSSASECIHQPASGEVAIRANSQERLRIDGSGNVGIGTASPGEKLEVAGNGAHTVLKIHEEAGTHDATMKLRRGTMDWEIGMRGSADLRFNFENDTKLYLDANGNVGIGTSSPGAELEVAGSNPSIKVKADADGEDSHLILHDHEGNGWTIYNEGANTSGAGVDSLLFRDDTNNATAMSIRAGGNVGIGTAGPGSRLHVYGHGAASGIILGTDPSNASSASIVNPGNYIEDAIESRGLDLIASNHGTTDNGTFRFFTSHRASGEKMRITNDGNVGIGTTTPVYSLEVHTPNGGGIGVQGASDTNNGWRLKPFGNDLQIVQSLIGGGERLTIQDSGNVGIGTTTPSGKLEIGGAGEGIVLNSPDGTQYLVTVANGGSLTTSAV